MQSRRRKRQLVFVAWMALGLLDVTYPMVGLWPTLLVAAYWLYRLLNWMIEASRSSGSINGCPKCGYDVRATPERCPECGTVLLEGIRYRGVVRDWDAQKGHGRTKRVTEP